jgi:hypothetical protein
MFRQHSPFLTPASEPAGIRRSAAGNSKLFIFQEKSGQGKKNAQQGMDGMGWDEMG